MYFTFAPTHTERFGGGQFQSITRLDHDRYIGLVIGQACDDNGTNSVQRMLVGVLTELNQQDHADEEARKVMDDESIKPFYAVDLSKRDCKFNPTKTR